MCAVDGAWHGVVTAVEVPEKSAVQGRKSTQHCQGLGQTQSALTKHDTPPCTPHPGSWPRSPDTSVCLPLPLQLFPGILRFRHGPFVSLSNLECGRPARHSPALLLTRSSQASALMRGAVGVLCCSQSL